MSPFLLYKLTCELLGGGRGGGGGGGGGGGELRTMETLERPHTPRRNGFIVPMFLQYSTYAPECTLTFLYRNNRKLIKTILAYKCR
jgi:hypothetical protein